MRKQHSPLTYLPVLLFAIVLLTFLYASDSLSEASIAQEKQFLENALQRSITQCYALEGRYPERLSYLMEHYGLSYNSEHFFVDYQYIGSNLRPDVTVISIQKE